MRNLDITTLRSFVAVADSGGVTRAAGFLHLTQSAVSMQLKRLEELLGLELLDRSGRTIALTASGEQVVAYARRMIALNDEMIARLTDQSHEGVISLGVPHDIVYPAIPQGLSGHPSSAQAIPFRFSPCAGSTGIVLYSDAQGKLCQGGV
jgi:DNA-binding transcriptional LysR family regulator